LILDTSASLSTSFGFWIGHNKGILDSFYLTMSEINSNNTDAVLGGQNPPPINAAVLGGEIGRKQRFQHEKAIARENKFWWGFEHLDSLPNSHATTFAERQVVNFEAEMDIANPQQTAYALRTSYSQHYNSKQKIAELLVNPKISKIEALVLGFIDYDSNNLIANGFLIDNVEKLVNLKAVFLGDIEDSEMMISSIQQDDVSPILRVYPNLETLHIRGTGVEFNEILHHEKLKVLRIESGGLNQSTIIGLNELELPALEYLELWLGRDEYGGDSSIDDLMPIISGKKFPKLRYLGLRNCEYADDIAFELAKSPILEQLVDLDLSMGTLGDDGLAALLNCPAINDLDILNVSQNWISKNFLENILPTVELKCQIIIDNQECYESVDRSERYCVVGE
jgi:hypothetical protein